MTSRRLLPLLLLLTVPAAAPAVAAPVEGRPRVLVIDFRADPALAAAAGAVTETVAARLGQGGDISVLGTRDLQAILAVERARQLVGCTDESCLVELGGALGAELVVAGSVQRLGGTWQVSAQLLDVRRALVIERATGREQEESRLFDVAAGLAGRLRRAALGPHAAPRRFGVRAGLSPLLGVLGVGAEVRSDHAALALGTGRYVLGGGLSLYWKRTGGPYLDLHAVWSRAGLLGRVSAPGVGLGATVGWDLRPLPWLSVKGGFGAAWNSARTDGIRRPLVWDLAAGVLF